MELEKMKRGREEEVKRDSEKKAKKKEAIRIDDEYDILDVSDSFRPIESGVFDFPWLNETLIVSEWDEWEIDDVFPTCLLETSGSNFYEDKLFHTDPDPAVLNDFHADKLKEESYSWPQENDDSYAVDCIWSSVLNQPLFAKGF